MQAAADSSRVHVGIDHQAQPRPTLTSVQRTDNGQARLTVDPANLRERLAQSGLSLKHQLAWLEKLIAAIKAFFRAIFGRSGAEANDDAAASKGKKEDMSAAAETPLQVEGPANEISEVAQRLEAMLASALPSSELGHHVTKNPDLDARVVAQLVIGAAAARYREDSNTIQIAVAAAEDEAQKMRMRNPALVNLSTSDIIRLAATEDLQPFLGDLKISPDWQRFAVQFEQANRRRTEVSRALLLNMHAATSANILTAEKVKEILSLYGVSRDALLDRELPRLAGLDSRRIGSAALPAGTVTRSIVAMWASLGVSEGELKARYGDAYRVVDDQQLPRPQLVKFAERDGPDWEWLMSADSKESSSLGSENVVPLRPGF